MTYVVKDQCIKCKYMDCVEVCPVDCFYEGENMLVIHPDECIDCGVCEPECPAEAISDDSDDSSKKWIEINRKYVILKIKYLGKINKIIDQLKVQNILLEFKNDQWSLEII